MTPHLSSLVLHRLRYGELTPDEITRARTHLDECPRCSAVLRTQENHRAAFELAPLPEAIKAASKTAPAPTWAWQRWFAWGVALAAAVVLTVIAVPRFTDDGVRIKGDGSTFEVWRDTTDGPAVLRDHGIVSAGDRIQARFKRPSGPWVTLAGVSARGEVEVHGTWAADMKSTDWQVAPFALELDDEPGDYALVLVFTDERPRETAVEAVARGGPLPEGAELRRLTLEKGP